MTPTKRSLLVEPEELTIRVNACARCGQDHAELKCARLQRPSAEWTHWATCPVTKEPVMVQILREPTITPLNQAIGAPNQVFE